MKIPDKSTDAEESAKMAPSTLKNGTLLVLDLIPKNLTQADIAIELGMGLRTVKRHFSALKDHNLIKLVRPKRWEVIPNKVPKKWHHQPGLGQRVSSNADSVTITHQDTDFPPDTTRGHGFVWRISIQNLGAWKDRQRLLRRRNINYVLKYGGTTPCIDIDGCKVHLCKKSIMFYFKEDDSYFSLWANDSYHVACGKLRERLRMLSSILNCNLKMADGSYSVRLIRQHYALIKNTIAKDYRIRGKKLYVLALDGTVRIVADYSMNWDELEYQHRKSGVGDADNMKNVLIDIANTGWRPKTTLEHESRVDGRIKSMFDLIEGNVVNVSDLIKDRKFHAANINSHIGAIRGMNSTLKRLEEALMKREKNK